MEAACERHLSRAAEAFECVRISGIEAHNSATGQPVFWQHLELINHLHHACYAVKHNQVYVTLKICGCINGNCLHLVCQMKCFPNPTALFTFWQRACREWLERGGPFKIKLGSQWTSPLFVTFKAENHNFLLPVGSFTLVSAPWRAVMRSSV